MRAKRRLQGLRPVVTWVGPKDRERPPPPEVRLFQARNLALRVMAVEKINRNPELLDIVDRNFERWQERGRATPGDAIRRWRALLREPWPRIAALLTEQSERGLTLRSTAPLFGVLSAQERDRIFRAFRPAPTRRAAQP
jgi:hypothetical protein